ncbi:MAG: hypothetical protein QOC84_2402 [Bradyrhizobium sp.]|nr:hypothetical protein [Bradyrhizobium sp.]
MMIVSLMRGDLRHEFDMADEAFALSPISASAALPSEQDYEAISHAFMETSRGRWFLGEFAKRNRNADTRMVLDAVARIEETVAGQRQQVSDGQVAEAVAAIRRAVYDAQIAAAAALDGLALEENLAPVRKGARIIKEISWRWREIGADARICDLLDSQVNAIEAACGHVSSLDPGGALSAAFDLIKERIAGFDDSATAAPGAENTAPSPAAPPGMPPAAVEAPQPASTTNNAEAATVMPADRMVAVAVTAEAADATAGAPDMAAEAGDAASQGSALSPEEAEPFDDALLDMIALEMAAPQAENIGDILPADGGEIRAADLPAAEPIIVAKSPGPAAAPAEPPAFLTLLQRSPQPFRQPSLGSSLIANGIVRKPQATPSDPLAPIRRMSQAEKIAFFS